MDVSTNTEKMTKEVAELFIDELHKIKVYHPEQEYYLNKNDLENCPETLIAELLRYGIVRYEITEEGLSYVWSEDARKMLTKEYHEKDFSIVKNTITDKGTGLKMTAAITDDEKGILITPLAARGNSVHEFTAYAIELVELTGPHNEQTGIWHLRVSAINQIKPVDTLCVLASIKAQLEPQCMPANPTSGPVWEYEDNSIVCEYFDISIRLDSITMGFDDALCVILETSNSYADAPEIALVTVTENAVNDDTLVICANYMKAATNPLINIYSEKYCYATKS